MTTPAYVLVDGENIDATLGVHILGRRPQSAERPRWERLLDFVAEGWQTAPQGLFFLAVNAEMPMAFVQALTALGYRPVPLRGAPGQKVVDIAIQRTLHELAGREADVMLVSNDGDFTDQIAALLQDPPLDAPRRRVGVMGFTEFRNLGLGALAARGLELYDLEYDVDAFQTRLPRMRVIAIDDFDPLDFL